jgi:hypothetical protein
MPEHYTKNTLQVTVWCNRCGKVTPHRVDDGRRGPCLTCVENLTRKLAQQIGEDRQIGLFFEEKER